MRRCYMSSFHKRHFIIITLLFLHRQLVFGCCDKISFPSASNPAKVKCNCRRAKENGGCQLAHLPPPSSEL